MDLPSACLGVTTLNADCELLSGDISMFALCSDVLTWIFRFVIPSVLTFKLKSSGNWGAFIGDTSISWFCSEKKIATASNNSRYMHRRQICISSVWIVYTWYILPEQLQEIGFLRENMIFAVIKIAMIMHTTSSISLIQFHFGPTTKTMTIRLVWQSHCTTVDKELITNTVRRLLFDWYSLLRCLSIYRWIAPTGERERKQTKKIVKINYDRIAKCEQVIPKHCQMDSHTQIVNNNWSRKCRCWIRFR